MVIMRTKNQFLLQFKAIIFMFTWNIMWITLNMQWCSCECLVLFSQSIYLITIQCLWLICGYFFTDRYIWIISSKIYLILISPALLGKKASLLFGIRFDDENFTILNEYLQAIEKKEDLVCLFFIPNLFLTLWEFFNEHWRGCIVHK